MKLICEICGDSEHHWRECPKLRTRKTLPAKLVKDFLIKEATQDIVCINDLDREELAKQIEQGYTSGRLDSETESGKTKHISWNLITKIWVD